jgi:hypothetical protein
MSSYIYTCSCMHVTILSYHMYYIWYMPLSIICFGSHVLHMSYYACLSREIESEWQREREIMHAWVPCLLGTACSAHLTSLLTLCQQVYVWYYHNHYIWRSAQVSETCVRHYHSLHEAVQNVSRLRPVSTSSSRVEQHSFTWANNVPRTVAWLLYIHRLISSSTTEKHISYVEYTLFACTYCCSLQ